ncbi:hypothetical protein D3C75_1037930 [compost metagenome]
MLEHAFIQVYTHYVKAVTGQQAHPLTTPAAKVNCPMGVIKLQQRGDERQVNLQPLGDQLRRPAIAVFKGAIERYFHRMHSTAVGTQAMPTN